MNLRTAAGIIVGDLIFVGSAVLLFYLSRVDPHAPASLGFMAISIAYGIGFALLSGFVAGLISHRRDLIAGMILALIIAVPALISNVLKAGRGRALVPGFCFGSDGSIRVGGRLDSPEPAAKDLLTSILLISA